jgi:hypothetical protein
MVKKYRILKLLLIFCLIFERANYSVVAAQNIIINNTVVNHAVYGNGRDPDGGGGLGEDPINNTVTIQNRSGVIGEVAGSADRVGLQEPVERNSLTIDINAGGGVGEGIITGAAYGGYSLGINSDAMDNDLSILNGTINGAGAYGGYSQRGRAESNSLVLSGGIIAHDAYGGRGQGDAVSNALRISLGNINGANGAYGGYSDAGVARDNSLEVLGGIIAHDAYGGSGDLGAINNRLLISSGNIQGGAYGGYSDAGVARDNSLEVLGGIINGFVYGGRSQGDAAVNNIVLIQNANVQGRVRGGLGETAASDNHVKILAGNFGGNVYGGIAVQGQAKTNILEIEGGMFTDNIVAGYSQGSNANENKMIISGGEFLKDIYVGKSIDGGAVGNSLEISGDPKFSINTHIYGGYSDTTWKDTFTGNVFHVKTNNIEIAGMGGFEFFKFYNPIKNGNPMIVCTTDKVDINNVEIDVEMNVDEDVDVGDKYNLIRSNNGFEGLINRDVKVKHGVLSKYDASIFVNNFTDLGIVITREYINPRAEIITQSKAATIEIVNEGLDLIVDEGIESAKEASMVAEGLVPFAAVKGGKSQMKTGAEIKIEGIEVMGGVAKEINKDGDKITIGGFVEHGRKKSKLLEEIDFDKISAEQTGNYSGVGVLARTDMVSNSYIEGSARIGACKVEFDTDNLNQEKKEVVTYDYDAMYIGGHVGVGYIYKINNKLNIDISSKFLFMHQEGKEIKLSSRDNIKFSGIETGKVRIGTNVEYKMSKQWYPYAGLDYDYDVLGGKVEAITIDIDLPTVEVKRGRFTGQAGIRKDIGKFNLDCSVKGYAGSKEGIDTMLKAKFYFDRKDITLTKIRRKAEKLLVKKVERRVNDLKQVGKVSMDKRLKNIKKENKEKLKLKKELKDYIGK